MQIMQGGWGANNCRGLKEKLTLGNNCRGKPTNAAKIISGNRERSLVVLLVEKHNHGNLLQRRLLRCMFWQGLSKTCSYCSLKLSHPRCRRQIPKAMWLEWQNHNVRCGFTWDQSQCNQCLIPRVLVCRSDRHNATNFVSIIRFSKAVYLGLVRFTSISVNALRYRYLTTQNKKSFAIWHQPLQRDYENPLHCSPAYKIIFWVYLALKDTRPSLKVIMIVGLWTNGKGEWGEIEVCNGLQESGQGTGRGPRCLLATQPSVGVLSRSND